LEFLESDTDTDSGWLTSEVRRCMHGPALPPVDKKAAGLCGWKWVDEENGLRIQCAAALQSAIVQAHPDL
jgi:hypothetical protein